MYQIALVVFREFLEIVLLLSFFSVAARRVKNFGYYMVAGIMLGAFGSAVLAFFTSTISSSLEGFGDEIFNIIIILVTVAAICWTIIWMKQHSKRIKTNIHNVSQEIEEGKMPKWIFTLLVATTIFREGSEIVLIVHSIVSVHNADEGANFAAGFGIGALGGILTGAAIYLGLFRLGSRYIFTVSTFFMTFIAAGLAAEAAKLITSIGLINILDTPLWDSSWIISDNSIIGKLLKVLLGYTSDPTGLELIFYCSTLGFITSSMFILNNKARR